MTSHLKCHRRGSSSAPALERKLRHRGQCWNGQRDTGLSVLPYTSSLCGLGQPHYILSFPINKRICRVCIQITCFTTPLSAMSWSYPIRQNIGEKSFQYQQIQDFSTVWKVPFTKLSQCSLSGANLSKHKMKKLNKIMLCFLHILL